MINPNSLFRWLSIRTKLIIAFVGLSLLPLLVVGSYAVFMNVKLKEGNALENLSHDVRAIRSRSSAFLTSVESDVRILRTSPLVREFFAKPDAYPSIQLEEELLAFARERRVYYQIRLISPDGTELLRVEPADPFDNETAYHLATVAQLRSGSEAWSFHIAEHTVEGQIAFGPAELSTPDGATIPVFSFVAPIDSKRGRCLLIANVYARSFFDVVQVNRHFADVGTIAIVNSEGQYLYHSAKKSDWNKLLASNEEDVLQKEYPLAVANAIMSTTEGTETEGLDVIVSHALMFDQPSTFTNSVFVFESIPKTFLLGSVYVSATILGVMLVLFLSVSAALAVVATRQFTRPVSQLQHGAEIIARGDYSYRLDISTHDEIEILAGHFNKMACALEEHERELQLRRASLEEVVASRTAELADEKMRLQTILDNVPTAFVLLDGNYRRLIASASFAQITGRPVEYGSTSCPTCICKPCLCIEAGARRAPCSHIDRVALNGGAERILEHLAIPHFDGTKLLWVLEMITDITERKLFEEHAIRNERLLAVGETASFVAHQMRNGLTSIKMLVQLRGESPVVPDSERRALNIVLGSITHLEQVVTDLLAFARPGPIVPIIASLNDLAAEAAVFVRPQFSAASITLKMALDPQMPRVPLDTTLVRESIIALLLNSVQAIGENGIVTVNTLHDENVVRIEVGDNGPGIDAAVLDHVFEPFFTTKPTGNGLGLAMARRIVEAHGGTTAAHNNATGGARFALTFPIS